MKDSFILYTEQKEVIDKLSDEQAGKLIKAIYNYAKNGEMPQLDAVLDLVVIPFKSALDRNELKWQETKKKRSEAGKLGAKIKQNKAKQANAIFAKQNKANQTENVNVNENVNENVNVNVNVNENNNVSDSCIDGLQEVIDFYNNNIGLLTPFGLDILSDYTKELNKEMVIYAMQISVEANKRTIQYIKAILNNWIKAGIKTLTDAKKESSKKKDISAEEEFLNDN